MIVKIQLPLVSTEPVPLALVYNEDRSYQVQIPVTAEIKKRMGEDVKAFFELHVGPGFETYIGKRVAWRSW
jgi:hypothetical protein